MFNEEQKSEEQKSEKWKPFINAVFVPAIIVVLMLLAFFFEEGMELDFHKGGIYPRSAKNIFGIFTYIFIHADIRHLTNNIFSFFVLSVTLFYFYKPLAIPILIYSLLISGALLWIIGRESWHIGASGLIYAIAFFLFFSGIIRKHIPLIAISLVITFLYGNMVWHVVPWQENDPVSWEGHLTGSISGLILAIVYRKAGPQKPIKIWDDEDEEDDFYSEYDDNDNYDSPENIEKKIN